MIEYLFVRMDVEESNDITTKLNALRDGGWRVISHAEASGEYSFVLAREQ